MKRSVEDISIDIEATKQVIQYLSHNLLNFEKEMDEAVAEIHKREVVGKPDEPKEYIRSNRISVPRKAVSK